MYEHTIDNNTKMETMSLNTFTSQVSTLLIKFTKEIDDVLAMSLLGFITHNQKLAQEVLDKEDAHVSLFFSIQEQYINLAHLTSPKNEARSDEDTYGKPLLYMKTSLSLMQISQSTQKIAKTTFSDTDAYTEKHSKLMYRLTTLLSQKLKASIDATIQKDNHIAQKNNELVLPIQEIQDCYKDIPQPTNALEQKALPPTLLVLSLLINIDEHISYINKEVMNITDN